MFASLRQSVDLCSGRYRVQVDADDWVLAPDAFEAQLRQLEAHPDMAFSYPSMTQTDSDGNVWHAFRTRTTATSCSQERSPSRTS